jgi:coenzyme F420-dependent glucose-6-phosphate dehydrogenase
VLYPGRIVLGMGTGESMNETPATGQPWPEQKERTQRFREALDLIETLWRGERVSYEGRFYRTANATIYDRPQDPVPIYIAGAGPVMAKLAGERAEGFICTSGKERALYAETLLPGVAAGLEKAGRAPDAVERMIEMKVSFDPDRRRALADTRNWGALALSQQEKHDVEDAMEMERLADALPVERTASRWIVSNDAEEHVARLKEYIDMGFNHLVFHAPGEDQARFLTLYAERVLPLLRKRFG